ncbi:hypothetical protein DI005_25265 [Prauserella sp. PE36]|uniref:hypothetical protein n=1 Tax=Prauserella sp. PE36 TaxID=1504709 RepID=UPI000DE3F007|nr:hypothetical protein [Prauserella sp. PE36]RBM16598.1 hypothetical protein DI005_25265 [Prauserella sp. PE36]
MTAEPYPQLGMLERTLREERDEHSLALDQTGDRYDEGGLDALTGALDALWRFTGGRYGEPWPDDRLTLPGALNRPPAPTPRRGYLVLAIALAVLLVLVIVLHVATVTAGLYCPEVTR